MFQLFEQKMFPQDSFYIDKVFAGKTLILYGAGECSHWFVEIVMKMYGYRPVVILDKKFSSGDTYEGIPAFSPFDYTPNENEKKDAIVVVCVGKIEVYEEIVQCLKELGYRNIISLLDVYEIHNPFNLPSGLTEKGFRFYLEHKEEIMSCLDLFEDSESQDVYTRCLQTHMTRKPLPLPCRPRKEQYFPADVPLNKGYSRFINCGAYDGDTIRLLNETHGKVKDIICFEPEPTIFKRLSEYLWKAKDALAENILALPCAVYSHETIMPFNNASGLGSRISAGGKSSVQCTALDHVLPGFKADFICMDVEGVEPEVLKGAEQLIRDSKPDLAICVYHSPAHLWEIPLYLHSLQAGYKFYLRNYTTFTGETVLYAGCP